MSKNKQKLNDDDGIVNIFECIFCKKDFARKYNLDTHLKNCKLKKDLDYNNELQKLKELKDEELKMKDELLKIKDEEIKNLLQKNNELLNQVAEIKGDIYKEIYQDVKNTQDNLLTKMVDKPTNVITNNQQNNDIRKMNNKFMFMAPFDEINDDKKIRRLFLNNYTEEYALEGGINGLIKFSNRYILKTPDGRTKYKLTDPSRKIYHYLDSQGNVHKDIECEKLINVIHRPASEMSMKIHNYLEDEIENMNYQLKEEAANLSSNEYNKNKDLIDEKEKKRAAILNSTMEIMNIKEEKTKAKFIRGLNIINSNGIENQTQIKMIE